jgi:hypothetical protein
LEILHRSSFVILSVHFIFIICFKHLFLNVYNLLVIWLVVFQVSQSCNNTDFTFVLNIRILTPFDILCSNKLLAWNHSWPFSSPPIPCCCVHHSEFSQALSFITRGRLLLCFVNWDSRSVVLGILYFQRVFLFYWKLTLVLFGFILYFCCWYVISFRN